MKLTIKTLQQFTFKLDIEPDKTVKELKDKIEADHGKDYPSGAQKLIYSGKILADESKLAEYNIDEKKFIVLMITRPPPPPKPAEAEKAAPVKKEEQTTGAKPKGSEDSKQAKQPTNNTTAANSTQSTSSSTTVSAAANTTTSAPTTTSTTPSTNTGQQSATAAANRQQATRPPSAMSDVSALLGEPQMASRLTSLMSQPQFRQIQDLIQQSPHLLSSTIEALAASDPEMYNFITENPDVFVSALNHPPLARHSTARSSTLDARARQGTPQQAGRLPAGVRQQPVVDQLLSDISEHDKEAIERLKELGFSEYLAVQAYMACDRDEQLAANLLFQMDS